MSEICPFFAFFTMFEFLFKEIGKRNKLEGC
jgi:hypothetical protein